MSCVFNKKSKGSCNLYRDTKKRNQKLNKEKIRNEIESRLKLSKLEASDVESQGSWLLSNFREKNKSWELDVSALKLRTQLLKKVYEFWCRGKYIAFGQRRCEFKF